MKKHFLYAGALLMMLLASCVSQVETTQSGLNPENFRTKVGDAQTDLYVLKNQLGMEVCITNFGGRIVSMMVPDKNGEYLEMSCWVLTVLPITFIFPVISGLLLVVMPTVSTTAVWCLTVIPSNCLKTISAIACTEGLRDGSTKYMTLSRLMDRRSN